MLVDVVCVVNVLLDVDITVVEMQVPHLTGHATENCGHTAVGNAHSGGSATLLQTPGVYGEGEVDSHSVLIHFSTSKKTTTLLCFKSQVRV